jgi:uncharacterized protein with LGFP repeats
MSEEHKELDLEPIKARLATMTYVEQSADIEALLKEVEWLRSSRANIEDSFDRQDELDRERGRRMRQDDSCGW